MVMGFLGWIYRFFAGIAGAVWLVFLYCATIWLVVGSLSAIQIRQALGDQNESFTFEYIGEAKAKYEESLKLYQEQGYQRATDADAVWVISSEIESLLRDVAEQLEDEYTNMYDYPLSAKFRQLQLDCQRESNSTTVYPVCGQLVDYEARTQTLKNINLSEIDKTVEQIRLDTEAKIDNLKKQHPLLVYYSEYQFWGQFSYDWLLILPQQVLVLLLTMAMGMLGSVITMTWSYVREDSGLTVRRFVVLPLVGSMSAFVILIFVSAGQLTLTAGDDNGALNPFVLSFLGIISGLLSERAYTRMADVGSNFFRVDDGQPRWANGLKPAMANAGVSTAELARHLYIAEEEAGRIVNETVTATLDQQRLIAACLRVPVRDIFTDVPPEGVATTVAAPDLTGLDAPALEAALRAVGLKPGAKSEALDDAAPPGVVIAQNPEPDARLPKGGRVDFTLAAARPVAADAAPQDDPPPQDEPPPAS